MLVSKVQFQKAFKNLAKFSCEKCDICKNVEIVSLKKVESAV